jgi:hypothetical protein
MPIPTVLPLSVGVTGISPALDISTASAVVAVIMPAAWTPAVVSLLGSADGTNFYDILDGLTGSDLFFNLKPGSMVSVNPNRLRGCKAIKLRSGTMQKVVPQAASRTFGIVVETTTASLGGTGAKPATGYIGTKLYWANGTGIVALPSWVAAPFNEVNGPHGVLENGGFRCSIGGPAVLSMNGYVQHQWDRWIIFGRRWNGGPIQEFGRVQIKSNDPVLVYYEMDVTLVQDGLLETFISSDFPWASFTWTRGAMMFLEESAPQPGM